MQGDEDCLPAEWERAVAAMRSEWPVREEWRAGVLRAVRAAPQPRVRAAASGARILRVAVAAAVAGFAIGAGTMHLAGRSASSTAREARAPEPSRDALGALASDAAERAVVRFVVLAPAAREVALVGEFNGWDPAAMPMRRAADGTWFLEAPIAPGRHRYAFLVDGRLVTDPGAPVARDDDFGVGSSVILVTRPTT